MSFYYIWDVYGTEYVYAKSETIVSHIIIDLISTTRNGMY